MEVQLQIKGCGIQTLFVLPEDVSEHENGSAKFILIRAISEKDKPFVRVCFDGNKLKVIEQRDIEEDNEHFASIIDHLSIDLIEALQEGQDLLAVDIPEVVSEVIIPYDAEKIRVDSSTMSLRQVFDMVEDHDINLSPDFQRNVVWDAKRKSRLIESVLLRIPLPVFYFSANETGQLAVVDGLQRLTAITEFMSNDLPLHGLEYLTWLEGYTYNKGDKKLEDKLYRRFNLTQITTNVIDSNSPVRVKYDIFRRLNTGGRPLNSQELRNCLASKELRDLLREMAHSEEFALATTKSVSDTRMDAQEYALRFLYFRYLKQTTGNIEGYSGNMDEDLDSFVDVQSKKILFDIEEYKKAYSWALQNAAYLFGRHAFRKVDAYSNVNSERSVINKALFLTWTLLLADFDPETIRNRFDPNSWISVLGNEISADNEYLWFLSYGTNGWKNLTYSYNKTLSIIKNQGLYNE